MNCISFSSLVVLINGLASPFFHTQHGLTKGFPLSPLMFLLVGEGLRILLIATRNKEDIRGIEVAENIAITHFLFVDETLLFSNGPR